LSISNRNRFRVLFDKIASAYSIRKKYIFILILEVASAWNQHCANCTGTLSFSMQPTIVTPQVELHSESKKQDTKLLPITSPNVNQFSNFFHWQTQGKVATK